MPSMHRKGSRHGPRSRIDDWNSGGVCRRVHQDFPGDSSRIVFRKQMRMTWQAQTNENPKATVAMDGRNQETAHRVGAGMETAHE